MKIIFLALISIPFIFPSCKKDKTEPCETNVTTLSGTYKLTSLRYKPSGGTESEVIGILDACELDDLTILNANGTYTYQDAGVVCTPNGSYPGTWTLNGSTITMEATVGTITGFDCTTALIFYTSNLPNPGDRFTYRYTRQ